MKIITIKEHAFKVLKDNYFPNKDLNPFCSGLSNEFYIEYFISYDIKFEYETVNREKESKISDFIRGFSGYTFSQTVISK